MPQKQHSVAKPPTDPWAGPVAPKVRPEPIAKTWRNDRDPNRRRATFEVLYPVWEITIEKSDDLHTKLPTRFEKTKRRSIQGVRFHLRVPNLIFSDADFHECKFHRADDRGQSNVIGATFKNCTFQRCMIGGTLFRHITFNGCTFSRCDFGASEFQECQFVDCKFTECTAENASFLATEIDPTKFLDGIDHHREWWLLALRAAKIDDFRWHDLRHTFASRLVMNGVDIFTVNRLLRHASIQMTMRYAHLADKHLKDAVEKLVAPRSDTESDTAAASSRATQTYVH